MPKQRRLRPLLLPQYRYWIDPEDARQRRPAQFKRPPFRFEPVEAWRPQIGLSNPCVMLLQFATNEMSYFISYFLPLIFCEGPGDLL
jgi:hypothetical protein